VKGQLASATIEAADDATMIVVARRAGSALRELVLGSLARQVLAHTDHPVLVVNVKTPKKQPTKEG